MKQLYPQTSRRYLASDAAESIKISLSIAVTDRLYLYKFLIYTGDIRMSDKSCFFIGHRSFSPKDDRPAVKNLRLLIAALAEEGVTDFYTGGSPGWDMFCARSVLIIRQYYPQLKLHLILPCPPGEQAAELDGEGRLTYGVVLDSASSIEVVSSELTKESMEERNSRLIEECDICICYLSKSRSRSVTGQTVRMARKAKRTVINMCTRFRNT